MRSGVLLGITHLLLLVLGPVGSAQAQAVLGLGLRPTYNPDDPYQVPDAPAPPTLPDLTHRAVMLSLETNFASVAPNDRLDGSNPGRVGVGLARLDAEAAVANRRWYVGYGQEIGTGRTLTGSASETVVSNPELWGRALWASQAGLAYGGGLAIVPPLIGRDTSADSASVRDTIRVVRPWDYPQFAGRVIAFRPFFDVRGLDGPVILQLRQGIDIVRHVGDDAIGAATTLTSRTTFYIGYRPMADLGIGLELWEVYFIKSPEVRDDQRAVFAVSPSIRWMSRLLQPAASLVFPIDRPLLDSAKGYWAIRLTLGLILDPSPPPSDPTPQAYSGYLGTIAHK